MRTVLVHGNASDARSWEGVRRVLGPDVEVIAEDLPGFGGRRGSAPRDLVAAVEALVEDDAVLVGAGAGGLICGIVAARAPERVKGLVVVGPVGARGGHERVGWLSRTRAGATLLRAYGVSPIGRRRFLRDQLADPRGTSRETCALLVDGLRHARGFHSLARVAVPESFGALRHLACPAVLLWGDRDGVLPIAFADALVGTLPRTVRLVRGDRAGHALHVERPDLVAREVRALFAACTDPPTGGV